MFSKYERFSSNHHVGSMMTVIICQLQDKHCSREEKKIRCHKSYECKMQNANVVDGVGSTYHQCLVIYHNVRVYDSIQLKRKYLCSYGAALYLFISFFQINSTHSFNSISTVLCWNESSMSSSFAQSSCSSKSKHTRHTTTKDRFQEENHILFTLRE